MKFAAVALLGSLLQAGAASGPNIPSVWWGRPEPAETQALDARAAAADQAMAFYGYGYRKWEIHALHSPLLRDHAIFKFLWANEQQVPTEFVLVLPLHGQDRMRIVPYATSGVVDEDSGEDLHNQAIFNALLAGEPQLHPKADGDWIALCEIYLNLIGEQPQVLTASNMTAVLGPVPTKSRTKGDVVRPEAPSVAHSTDGTTVAFTTLTARSELVAWVFQFSAGPHLLQLTRTVTRKAP